MKTYENLLQENKIWAKGVSKTDPDFFKNLSSLQKPDFLWIGCSDSRVPADRITNTQPGEIFVHRNIANLVVHTDTNLFSVLDYAVTHLEVKHIIVCGHYGCGGVKAAMSTQDFDQVLNMWLRNIKDVYSQNQAELDAIENLDTRTNRLVELNVIDQVINLAKTSVVQRAWEKRQSPQLHGWVYGLNDGLIHSVFEMNADTPIDPLYKYDNL